MPENGLNYAAAEETDITHEDVRKKHAHSRKKRRDNKYVEEDKKILLSQLHVAGYKMNHIVCCQAIIHSTRNTIKHKQKSSFL
jgi:hypothetical protein